MIYGAIEAVTSTDLTAAFAVEVLLAAILAVVWVNQMAHDPANSGLPGWDLRLRRFGVVGMVLGLLLTVLYAGDQGWKPWPPMLLVAAAFDFYLGSALVTVYRRIKMRADHFFTHNPAAR